VAGARESDEAFECEAKMADALQVIAERMGLWSGANYEYIASAYAAFEIMVEQYAVSKPPQTEPDGDQPDGDHHDAAGNVFGVKQKQRAGQQQPGCKAGLNTEPLLMQDVAQVGRRI
jgi:hypothetical protein